MNTKAISCWFTAVVALAACNDPPKQSAPSAPPPAPSRRDQEEECGDGADGGIQAPLPKDYALPNEPLSEERVSLGRMLYFDKRLSKNHDLSCNSCHLLDKYGADGQKTSPGHKKQLGSRNSPTVYNAAGHFVQFWDGRSAHVEHQATQPVMNPVEMAMPDEKRVVETLESIPEYVAAFKKAFPESTPAVTLENAGKAMGAFERGLVTPSRWDEFLAGKSSALTNEEQEGFQLFVESGCSACHMGTHLGGQMYQKLGVLKPWPNQVDQGRYEITKQESDKMMFKVPGLRNIAETAPYFHDGSAATLEQAILMMAEYQLGKTLTPEEAGKMATWMRTLTGPLPTEYIKEPPLPASTPKTPKPDPT